MRTAIALAAGLAGVAVAAPATRPAPWADWVGDYSGALVWRNCTAPGEPRATLAFEAIDGTAHLELARAGAALGTMSLQQDDAAWGAQDGDLTVRITRKRPDTLDLVVTYESGCNLRAHLRRVTTGVAACDRLLGWSRIEARCSKTSARLEDFAALARTKPKAAEAARCAARADRLERAMIDAGCAPHPDPGIGVRAVACRALAGATAKLERCGRVPPALVQRLAGTATALASAAQTAEAATLTYVERQCQDAHAEVKSIAVQFQCQL